ncbi:MAG: ParA family protein [Paludibacter sp.]|nr:ParA family protein [Paludibacter sp.]
MSTVGSKDIDFAGMAEYFIKSERTLRRWATEKESKFAIMLEEYQKHVTAKEDKKDANSTIVVTLSFKGGVGKSTISDALGFYLDDTIVLNSDLGQPASKINACPTVDYADVMNEKTIIELIEELSQEYRYIIVDTPGELNSDVLEVLKITNKLIIPMTIGARAIEATTSTLMTFFGDGSDLEGKYDVYFFFNNCTDRQKRAEAIDDFKKAYSSFQPKKGLELRAKLGAFDSSKAISTAENTGKSIFQLDRENRSAYKTVTKKLTSLCAQIEEHLGLN